jgi:hypothetical protein
MAGAGNYLLVKGISGLGNRIECVLTAILYARLSGRKLIVDWSDDYYANDGTNAFHRFFQCPMANSTDAIPRTDSVVPALWRGHLGETAANFRKKYEQKRDPVVSYPLSIEPKILSYSEDIAVLWMYHEKVSELREHFAGDFGEFAHKSNKAILAGLLRDELRLHPDIRKRVDEFKAAHFVKRTVGVHVRYTDHRVPLRPILAKLNTLLQREKDLSVFLATDNLRIKRMFLELYPGTLTTSHWYPDRPGVTLHNNRNNPNLLESGAEALVDLYLLAECDYLIMDTSSSFAGVAALLTKAPPANILDVRCRGKLPSLMRTYSHRLMLRTGAYGWGIGLLTLLLKTKPGRWTAKSQCQS